MTEELIAPRSGAPAPDPFDLAHAADDMADATRLLDLANRAVVAEQRRLQLSAHADRVAVLEAWRTANTLLQEAVAQAMRKSAALVALTVAAAKALPDDNRS